MPHLDGIFQLIEYLSPVSSALPGCHIGVRTWFTGLGYYFTIRENCLIKRHFFSMRRNVWLSAFMSICGALVIGCTIPGLSAGKMAHLIKK